MVREFLAQPGRRIVCGGTTNRIVARYLGKKVETSLDYVDERVPPVYHVEGIDLSTEAVVTISRVLEFMEECLSGTRLVASW